MSPSASSLVDTRSRRGWVSRVLPTAIYTLLIFYFGTARTGVISNADVPYTDKVLHALVFGGLAALTYRALRWFAPHRGSVFQATMAVCVAAFFGGMLEVVQSGLGYRSAELADFVADVLGAVVMVSVSLLLRLDRPLRAFLP